jgi:microcystin-dependent protein
MSFIRAKNNAINKNVYDSNRLANFNKPHIRVGDLYIERNEYIGGNLTIGGDLSANNFYAANNFYIQDYLLIPYGTIIQSAATTIPKGWLLCDGRSVSKILYSNLYGAIGVTYGGTLIGTDFNLPNLNRRVIVGAVTNDVSYNLANTGGEERHTLTVAEMPSHSHSTTPSSGYGLIKYDGTSTMNAAVNDGSEPNLYTAPNSLTINDQGGDQSHNNMQPYIALYYLIKY